MWLCFVLAWGTIQLISTMKSKYDGNSWGFGQVFSIILLVLPVLSIGQSYFGELIWFASCLFFDCMHTFK